MSGDLLPVLRSQLLSSTPGVTHGITQRVQGMSPSDGQVGYSPPRDQQDAWRNRQCWAAVIGVDAERLVTPGQVHGNTVLVVTAEDGGTGAQPGSGIVGQGDAMITAATEIGLFSLHADCMPILLAGLDAAGEAIAVGAVHAGWRGTVVDVVGRAVLAMRDQFGIEAKDVIAYLGPAIGACCYEVGPEVTKSWIDQAPDGLQAVINDADGVRFDLAAANVHLLERAGVSTDRIEVAGLCTKCEPERWFSHRGHGPETGRFAAVIALTKDRPDYLVVED